MSKRCVIIGGAAIQDYEYQKKHIRGNDFIIVCDSGLRHINELGVSPDLIVGDFDSWQQPENPGAELIVLPCEKDDTDTVFAAKEALNRGFTDIVVLGAVGGRLDHTIGNVGILQYIAEEGGRGLLVDDYSEMTIVGSNAEVIEDNCSYFSLLAIYGDALGVNIQNAKYPLEDAIIRTNYQYGISNEVIPGQKAKVWVEQGNLLLVKIR